MKNFMTLAFLRNNDGKNEFVWRKATSSTAAPQKKKRLKKKPVFAKNHCTVPFSRVYEVDSDDLDKLATPQAAG